MHFNSIEQLNNYLKTLKRLGFGAQGSAYYDSKYKVVLKIYDSLFEEEDDEEYEVTYTYEDVMKFNGIESDTFIFPSRPIYLKDKIIGYVSRKAPGKLLTDINPLRVDFDIFAKSAIKGYLDTVEVSKAGVMSYDMVYNIMYGNGKISVIDTDDYSRCSLSPELTIRKNTIAYNTGITRFLIDNYFEDVLEDNRILREMYIDRTCDISEFLKEFKTYLEERSQREIKKLGDVKELVNKTLYKPTYVRTRTNMDLFN